MEHLTQTILPLSLAFIMFSMGLTLTLKDFTNITKFPKPFIIGATLQLTSLPLIAYLIASLGLSYGFIIPEVAVGLVVIAACPGGVSSNLLVHMARGNTALSISLTSIISVLSVITIPFIVNFAYNSFLGAENTSPLPIAKTIVGIFAITVIPVILGMVAHAKNPIFTKKFEEAASRVSSILFVLIVFAVIFSKWTILVENFSSVWPITLIFNICIMLTTLLTVKLFSLSLKDQIAIVIECGLQNGTLAIMITLTFLNNEAMMLPGALYSISMFLTGGLYLLYIKKTSKI